MTNILIAGQRRNGGFDNREEIFTTHLDEVMREQNMTTKELARLLGISESYASQIRHGAVVPGPYVMWLVATLLGKPVIELWSMRDSVKILSAVKELAELRRRQCQIEQQISCYMTADAA